ncbi:mercuric reductase [Adhaeribacter pallidiroseus]|uniref:Glutathione-disulfide reductase n=1 Tax=Adhaeribacter pallidiroseus TaxID=2072847 RepID=A0A369QJN8_9BACT|nr:mercuric reductase [Adhaeribacter pallidiroseus]RDC63436.1 Glutathione-disulfide reductase [Adhaeribacter pallidiroseus]
MKHFDAVIIGSGQGGTPLAKKLAQAGWKTALIERRFIGGTCVNDGCTPTKTMIASAKVAYTVAQAAKWGVEVPEYHLNLPAIIHRKTEVVHFFRNGSQQGLEKTPNLTVIFGEAYFTGNKQIHVNLKEGGSLIITADQIFIDAGTRPKVPDIPGLAEVGYFDSTTILDFTELPPHLVILGSNYIGLEFGQMYRRFGSQVTILEHNEQFLKREDEDVAAEVRQFLEKEEIQILTQTEVTCVTRHKKDIQLSVSSKGQVTEITGSHILVATGRKPNTDTLNLEAAGVEVDSKGYIVVNEKLETTAPGIYALGDITGGPKFTHIAYNDYVILYHNLLEQQNSTTKNRLVPYCLFTDPQVGRVGITEKEARQQGLNVKVAKLPMASVARAIETGDTRGLLKAVVDAETNQIIGVAVVGQEGGEIMSVLQMAMLGKIDYKQMKEMVFAHPLYAESLNNLFLTLDKPQ